MVTRGDQNNPMTTIPLLFQIVKMIPCTYRVQWSGSVWAPHVADSGAKYGPRTTIDTCCVMPTGRSELDGIMGPLSGLPASLGYDVSGLRRSLSSEGYAMQPSSPTKHLAGAFSHEQSEPSPG